MRLNDEQLDRARGAVLGAAAGDALGAAYEFESIAIGPDGPQMLGGGLGDFEAGEWTDDTTMTWCILDVAATHTDLRTEAALTAIAQRFRQWFEIGPADIGIQTRLLLDTAGPSPTGQAMTSASRELHQRTGHTAGNGSLMRTAPITLRYLDNPQGLAEAARAISALTHYDPQAQDACALWSLAIRHAILNGEFDLRAGLKFLDPDAVSGWVDLIDEAEQREPSYFNPNRWVVTAFQAAWSAIVHTPIPQGQPSDHLANALEAAIRIGDDTDTVAAITGGLLGACWGASTIAPRWRAMLHGYPGIRADDLLTLVDSTAISLGRQQPL